MTCRIGTPRESARTWGRCPSREDRPPRLAVSEPAGRRSNDALSHKRLQRERWTIGLRWTVLLAWSFALAGNGVWAQAPASSDIPKPYPLPIPHETVIVVAQDAPDDVRTTGRDVLVIRAADAQASGFKTVADVLRFYGVLNVVTTGTTPGSLTSVFIRGGDANYTLVVVDNVPVNEVGGFYDFAHLPLENIERIEILKGPGSSVYGSEAVTAVIRVFTRRGTGRPKVRLSGLGGSFQTFGGTVESDGALGRGWHYSVSLGGLRSDRQLPVNDEYRGRTASVQVGADTPGGHAWALRYRFGDSDVHFPTQGAGDRFDVLDPQQFQRTKEHIAGWSGRPPGRPGGRPIWTWVSIAVRATTTTPTTDPPSTSSAPTGATSGTNASGSTPTRLTRPAATASCSAALTRSRRAATGTSTRRRGDSTPATPEPSTCGKTMRPRTSGSA
jgi:outer membrane receptor protein involved in Fe transport